MYCVAFTIDMNGKIKQTTSVKLSWESWSDHVVLVGGGTTERDSEKSADPAVSEAPGQSEVTSLAPAGAPAVLDVPVLSPLLILMITS